jgi:hypothetical protein
MPTATPEEIYERCVQFSMMRLPGQPFGIHMGTSYLVNDLRLSLTAALARLAVAREWIALARHLDSCEAQGWEHPIPCTCGRDALLAALEVPK